ncbi:signal peptidase I [Hamadaea sp. NPDC051192]|uniref:signal peptidase I n=1 Tax=Hamadaea sp. NPDC051192 TaxID=3154940 RepID=UPI0034369B44
MTDRTYDRWPEQPRWEDSREPGRDDSRDRWPAEESAEQYPPQRSWADPQDPRWESDSRSQDPRYSDPRYSDSRYSDSRYSEPRSGEPRYDEPRYDDPRYDDPRYDDLRRDEPRQEDRSGYDQRWGSGVPAVPASRSLEPVNRPAPGGSQRRQRRKLKLWQEIPLLLVIALGVAFLVQTFLFRAYYIPSSSMEDTLVRGDRVLVNKVVYHFGDPERGDVVVFKGPSNWTPEFSADPNASFFSKVGSGLSDLVGLGTPGEKDFIKRVIGVPGDRVSCCDVKGRIFVNGTPIDEPYVTKNANKDSPKTPGQCGPRQFDEVVVEPGMLFVMGDNRFVSQDSRCRGLVPIENVIGRAGTVVWPISRWDSISESDPFQSVPTGQTQGLGVGPVLPVDPAGLAIVAPVWLARRNTARSRRLRA